MKANVLIKCFEIQNPNKVITNPFFISTENLD